MKQPLYDANIILTKCHTHKKLFGVRVEKMNDGDWWRTWSFPINESQATNEGFDKSKIQGNLNGTEDYPGCPYCGTWGFVQCNSCRKLTCWQEERSLVCEWCGQMMNNIAVATSKFDVSGGDY